MITLDQKIYVTSLNEEIYKECERIELIKYNEDKKDIINETDKERIIERVRIGLDEVIDDYNTKKILERRIFKNKNLEEIALELRMRKKKVNEKYIKGIKLLKNYLQKYKKEII
ncbi:MAG: hypothetical protein QXJ28_01895 [Candidatus Pacearchaeota archaeon]